MTSVAEILSFMERHYPAARAETWDKPGLVCGAPDWPVSKVLLVVDITSTTIAQAREVGADMIIAHHPLLLKGIHGADARTPKGHLLLELATNKIACVAAHTNADIPEQGVCAALADAIGLQSVGPLDGRPSAPLDQLVAFVPTSHTQEVVDALAAAGAGAIGDYDRCHFAVEGTGSFRPLAGAEPHIGSVGEIERVREDRVEMVLPRSKRSAVVQALLTSHPYEEPAWHVLELAPQPASDGIGRLGELPEPLTAAEFAQRVADALPATTTGVRLAGDPARSVKKIAVLAGAGDSHLDQARRSGADAYLTSDLRHHPATEALEWAGSPVLLDVAHWAAEWTWLPVLAGLVREELAGVEPIVSEVCTDAWAAAYHR